MNEAPVSYDAEESDRLSRAALAKAGAPILYAPEEAGQIMGQTANWMKAQARNGLIPHTRVGRKIMFSPQDLAEAAHARRQVPQPVLVPRLPHAAGQPIPGHRNFRRVRRSESGTPHDHLGEGEGGWCANG